MKLQDVFDQLSTGELSQLSIGGQDAGVISEANWHRVLPAINLGLTALYKRFLLKEGRITIDLLPNKYSYVLHSDYSIGSRRRPGEAKYLRPVSDPKFMDDIQKVERVITDYGFDLPLNDASQPYSVRTTKANQILVPKDIVQRNRTLADEYQTDVLDIVYRAGHPRITIPIGYFDPSRVEIDLPAEYLHALALFIASLIHTPVGLANEGQTGNNYGTMYEMECMRLENEGLEIGIDAGNTRFQSKGWV